jgi:hypothetical protein
MGSDMMMSSEILDALIESVVADVGAALNGMFIKFDFLRMVQLQYAVKDVDDVWTAGRSSHQRGASCGKNLEWMPWSSVRGPVPPADLPKLAEL